MCHLAGINVSYSVSSLVLSSWTFMIGGSPSQVGHPDLLVNHKLREVSGVWQGTFQSHWAVQSDLVCAKTKAMPFRHHWGPITVPGSDVLVSLSSPVQPGHQGSPGRGVPAPPTVGGQPASATPRQPSSCSFCFQPLRPGQAGGFLSLLGLPL